MKLRTALRLGRVSNLPTVWTNALAGWTLAGGSVPDARLIAVMLATSCLYVAGMYLNDVFDARIDAIERPERPIPAGAAAAPEVAAWGGALLAAGLLVLTVVGFASEPFDARPLGLGVALALAILWYDWRHKRDPLSPLWMGVCRALVYLIAGATVTRTVPASLGAAALVLLCYLVGLTYIAKQETLSRVRNLWPLVFLAAPLFAASTPGADARLWAALAALVLWTLHALSFLFRRRPGDIPRAVGALLAGISLVDALFLAQAGATWPLLALAFAAFALTLVWQRRVPGT